MPTLSLNSQTAIRELAAAMQGMVDPIAQKGHRLGPDGLYDLSQYKPVQFDYKNPENLKDTAYSVVAAMAAYNTSVVLKRVSELSDNIVSNGKAALLLSKISGKTGYRHLINDGIKDADGRVVIYSGVIFVIDDFTLQIALHLLRFSLTASLDAQQHQNGVTCVCKEDKNFAARQEQLLGHLDTYFDKVSKQSGAKVNELLRRVIQLQNEISQLKSEGIVSLAKIDAYEVALKNLTEQKQKLSQELNKYFGWTQDLGEGYKLGLRPLNDFLQILNDTVSNKIKECDVELDSLKKKAIDLSCLMPQNATEPLEHLKSQLGSFDAKMNDPSVCVQQLRAIANDCVGHANYCELAIDAIVGYRNECQQPVNFDREMKDQRELLAKAQGHINSRTLSYDPLIARLLDLSDRIIDDWKANEVNIKPLIKDAVKAKQNQLVEKEDEVFKRAANVRKLDEANGLYNNCVPVFQDAAKDGRALAEQADQLADQIEQQQKIDEKVRPQLAQLIKQLNDYIQKCDTNWEKFKHIFKWSLLAKKKQTAEDLKRDLIDIKSGDVEAKLSDYSNRLIGIGLRNGSQSGLIKIIEETLPKVMSSPLHSKAAKFVEAESRIDEKPVLRMRRPSVIG